MHMCLPCLQPDAYLAVHLLHVCGCKASNSTPLSLMHVPLTICLTSHNANTNFSHKHKLVTLKQEDSSKPQKAKWGFLQKYWHKGAFFQDEAGEGVAMQLGGWVFGWLVGCLVVGMLCASTCVGTWQVLRLEVCNFGQGAYLRDSSCCAHFCDLQPCLLLNHPQQQHTDDMRATIGTDDIFKRDFSAPTGEDNFDKSMLPKVMQVRYICVTCCYILLLRVFFSCCFESVTFAFALCWCQHTQGASWVRSWMSLFLHKVSSILCHVLPPAHT